MSQTSELQEFLYMVRPTRASMVTEGPTPEEMEILGQHMSYLSGLTQRGEVLLFGRTQNNDEDTFGIVVFTAPSEDEARRLMNEDPAVRGGLMQATLYPYQVAGMAERGLKEKGAQ